MKFHKFSKDSSLRKLKFKQNKDKYIKVGTLIFSVVVIIIGVLYLSFAKYESSNAFSVINSSVGAFTSSEVSVKFYLDGTTTEINPESMPYTLGI